MNKVSILGSVLKIQRKRIDTVDPERFIFRERNVFEPKKFIFHTEIVTCMTLLSTVQVDNDKMTKISTA